MNLSEIANRIDELTGSWTPSGAATSQDLRKARLHLADGFFSNTAPQGSQSPPGFRSRPAFGGRPESDALAELATSAPAVMPYVRNATDVDPAAYADVAGMKVDKILGPFVDSFGVTHWVDLIPLPHRIPISSATRGVLGFLVIDFPSAQLGPGSIWVSVVAFNVPQATAGALGLSFSTGTVHQTGAVTLSASGVTIGPGGKLTLELTLAPPTPPPGLPGLGRDVQQMSLNLPAHVTIEFAEAGAAFSAIDNSSATVYGTAFTLKRNLNKPRLVGLGLSYLLFPCDASIAEFAFQNVLSTDVVPSGQATITEAGWALPVTTASPLQLGAASSAGSVVLELGSGLSLRFGDLEAPASLSGAKLALASGNIIIAAVNGPREIVDRLILWNPAPPPPLLEPAPDQHSSEIDATISRGALLFANVSGQIEWTVAFGRARANVDRPLASDGRRLPIAFSSALIAFIHTAAKAVIVIMSVPDLSPGGSQQAVIALENVLLRVGPAAAGVLYALYSGTRLVGALEFTFEDVRILPTLPDPYASANVALLPIAGTVWALDTWTLAPGAILRFGIVPAPSATAPKQIAAEATVVQSATTLLDLSTNADQIGVSFGAARGTSNAVMLEGMALAAPQELLSVYALPGVSWEPVVDQDQDDWLDAPSPDDGPPIALRVKTANLVRIEPNIVLPALAHAEANADILGRFTLPYGLIATLQMTANDSPAQRPFLSFVRGNYTTSGLSAARQLSIRAQSVIKVGEPALPGSTTTGSPLPVPLNSTVYGVLALGNDPLGAAQFFDQEFSAFGVYPQIPVTRIDISGYGTSMFSDWKNLDFKTVGVVRTRFDVLVGRTAFELVQIATVIIPWCIRITRTVIFDRFDSGLVVRHDTGWKATGIGKFEILQLDQQLLGAIERLQNVHNIAVGTGPTIKFASPDVHEPVPPSQQPPPPQTPLRTIEFVPVTFDADIVMNPSVTAISQGNTSPLAAGTQILGYAQLTVGQAASALEILKAMQQLPGGVSGSVGCILNVGSAPDQNTPKFTLNVSSIVAKTTKSLVAGQTYPALALALMGTPRLPRDGAWSVTRRSQNDAQPSSVDPTFPIPLIFGSNNDRKYQWRLLGPEDALTANSPGTVFGLMQGTGTSKILFENPVIGTTGQSLLLDPSRGVPPARLADLGSLLGAAGIFPNLANVLQIPTAASDALHLVQDGFQKTFTWTLSKNHDGVTALDDQKLLDLGVVSMVLQYQNAKASRLASATFTVDAAPPAGQPRWSLEIRDLAAAVFVAGFGSDALLTIHGGFKANELSKAGFTDIQIDYGSALGLITKVLEGIKDVVTAIGGSVNLDIGFSGDKLTVRDGFALPTLPLGLGELQHIGIDLGLTIEIPSSAEFTVGFASKEDPFTWIVDPLAGNGAIVLGTSGGDMGVFIEAGIGVALAINVAIASGGASIILDFSFQLQPPDIFLSIALTGNANVDVLDGLASAALTLTASITVELIGLPPTTADFIGAVAVGIHISIAWVVNVDFDGSWSFSESVPLHLP